MNTYLKTVQLLFREKGNPEVAFYQMKYMRNQYAFFGLKAPEWMALAKEIVSSRGIPEGEDLKKLVRLCYEDEHREMQYFGLELVQRSIRKQPENFIHFLEELLTAKSWWDTVDWIAPKMTASHFKRFPSLVPSLTDRWIESDNIWLQRTAIIFQLKYKKDTDADLLYRYILRRADSREFFVQKGAGWALREYSKTNPGSVRHFIENNRLPALTRREGLKRLGD